MPARDQREAQYRYLTKLRARLLGYYGARCNWVDCTETRALVLEFAHLKPTKLKGASRGRYQRLRDVRQHPEHYTVLCHECHRAFDYRKIQLDIIPQPTERGTP